MKDVKEESQERAFEIADSVEQGIARETVTEFVRPLRRSSALWRFHVIRSEDKLEYRLFADDGDFLMYAKASLEAQRIDMYLYNPTQRGKRLFDASRPAFTLSHNKDKTEWRLVQERCELCQFAPKHLSCSCVGKQQVACISHTRKPIGDGIFNCMDIKVPGLHADSTPLAWCPLAGHGDLAASSPETGPETQSLTTTQPTWNDEIESLVLNFKGRSILSSAKNFQLTLRQKPDHVVCQYGKIGPNTFSLDFKYPLSVVQAFGTSLSTLFWT
jgi:hypothetical protein